MNDASIEINGCIRVAVQVPDSALRVDFSKTVDESIPIVIAGDSSQQTNLTLGWELLRDLGYRGPFIADLLLVNGTTNRFLRVTVERSTERWTVETALDGDFTVSSDLERRCDRLQAKYLAKAGPNVLFKEQKDALMWDLPLPK